MTTLPEPVAAEQALLDVMRGDIRCTRNGDELVLDTPLILQDGSLLRVYLIIAEHGGLDVTDGGFATSEVEAVTRSGAALNERYAELRTIAKRNNLVWDEGEFRAHAADLPEAMRRVALLGTAVDRALTLASYTPPRIVRPVHQRLLSAFKHRGLKVQNRKRLPIGDEQTVTVDYEVRNDGNAGAVEVLTGKTPASATGAIQRSVTALHSLDNGGYEGRLIAVYDEQSPVAGPRFLERFAIAKPRAALLFSSEQAVTAIPELLGA